MPTRLIHKHQNIVDCIVKVNRAGLEKKAKAHKNTPSTNVHNGQGGILMGRPHLTLHERETLARCLHIGLSLRSIGCILNRSPAGLCKERKRNSQNGAYSPYEAHGKACRRRKRSAHRKKKLLPALEAYIFDKMQQYWSPEQVAGRLPVDFPNEPGMRVSFKTIYRRIDRGIRKGNNWRQLYSYLRLKRNGKSLKKHASRNPGPASLLRSIDLRPDVVKTRQRFGDWESDLLCGPKGKGHIATFVERRTGFLLAAGCKQKSVVDYDHAALQTLGKLPAGTVHTVTVDRGCEFYGYQNLEQKLGTRYYFCHARCPNERALNEYTNGLLRQFFPRNKPLLHIEEELERAVTLLNHRPRKTLGYKTPAELLELLGMQQVLTLPMTI